jgi:hypothetical protein
MNDMVSLIVFWHLNDKEKYKWQQLACAMKESFFFFLFIVRKTITINLVRSVHSGKSPKAQLYHVLLWKKKKIDVGSRTSTFWLYIEILHSLHTIIEFNKSIWKEVSIQMFHIQCFAMLFWFKKKIVWLIMSKGSLIVI